MTTAEAIAKRLRELRGIRTRRGVCDETGIGYSAMTNYENAVRIPSDRTKKILANYYGLTVDELFYSEKYYSE